MDVNVVAEPTQGAFMGVPSYFQDACITARRGGIGGGYYWAGGVLSSHFEELCPDDLDQNEWTKLLTSEIEVLFHEKRLDEVEAWLIKRFPRCMELIPRRARANFVLSVWETWEIVIPTTRQADIG